MKNKILLFSSLFGMFTFQQIIPTTEKVNSQQKQAKRSLYYDANELNNILNIDTKGQSNLVNIAKAKHETLKLNLSGIRPATNDYTSYQNDAINKVNSGYYIAQQNVQVKETKLSTLNKQDYDSISILTNLYWAEVFNKTLQTNEKILTAVKQLKGAKIGNIQAISNMILPKVDLNAASKSDPVGTQKDSYNVKSEQKINFSYNILNRGQDIAKIRKSNAQSNAQKTNLLLTIEETMEKIIETTANLIYNIQLKKYNIDLLYKLQESKKIIDRSVSSGHVNKIEQDNVALEIEKALLNLNNIENTIAVLKREFFEMTGTQFDENSGSPIMINKALENVIKNVNTEHENAIKNQNTFSQSLNNVLKIKQASEKVEESKINKQHSFISLLVPEIEIGASIDIGRIKETNNSKKEQENNAKKDFFTFNKWMTYGTHSKDQSRWSYSLLLKWNIFNKFNDLFDCLQTSNSLDAAVHNLISIKKEAESKLSNVYQKYLNALHIIEHQKRVVALKEKAVKSTEKEREIGTKTLKDVIDAINKLHESLKTLSEHESQLIKIVWSIYKLTGNSLPKSLVKDIRNKSYDNVVKNKYFISAKSYQTLKS